MKKRIFLIILIMTSLSIIQQSISSSITDETPTINDDDKVIEIQPIVEPAPQWIIDKINDYIISMVGEDYFAQHFELKKSQTNINLDKTGAKYILNYIYTHNLKNQSDDMPYQVEHQFTLRTDSNGELVSYKNVKYKGPKKSYEFLISKNEAKIIAIQNDLEEPVEVSLSYGDQGYNSDSFIDEGTYVWVAWSKKCITKGNIEGLFIDVDVGDIISKKTSYRTCVGGEDEEFVSTDKEKEIIKPVQNVQIKNHKNFFQKLIDWIKSLFRK